MAPVPPELISCGCSALGYCEPVFDRYFRVRLPRLRREERTDLLVFP
jgi:hypothetical protein